LINYLLAIITALQWVQNDNTDKIGNRVRTGNVVIIGNNNKIFSTSETGNTGKTGKRGNAGNTVKIGHIFRTGTTNKRGTAVAQWLRCCATNRKVAGSIPAGISGFH
jgi:acyl-[acyl carrier protein]--UDP-N-acetylglucosamine O-acyltransferase